MDAADADFEHVLADIVAFDGAAAASPRDLESALLRAAAAAGLRPAAPAVVRLFEPQGATGVLVLMESHISLHTYPEKGVIKADAFTCRRGSGERAVRELAAALGGRAESIRVVLR